MKDSGKVQKAMVIGASSGMGKEIALQLAEQEYHVAVTGRRTKELQELQSLFPSQIIYQTIDNTAIASLEQNLVGLTAKLGGLDLLVISSGIGELNGGLDFEIEQRTIALNVTGFTKIADWAILYFQNQNFGHLAAITSLAGMTGGHAAPAYNASKAYQINYLSGLRKKMKKLKLPIAITDIRPGFVDTEMAKGEGLFWISPVQKAASQIISAIKSKRKIVYITHRWRIIGMFFRMIG